MQTHEKNESVVNSGDEGSSATIAVEANADGAIEVEAPARGFIEKIKCALKTNDILRTVLKILAVCIVISVLTFISRYISLIPIFAVQAVVRYLLYLVMIGVIVLACVLEKRSVLDLGFYKRNMLFQILIGLAIAIVMAFVIGALPILIGGAGASMIGGRPSSGGMAAYSIITDIIFIGTMEELIFRGYIQRRINELTKYKFIGVLVAAALFGLWHIINGSWFQVLFTFVIGAVFGFMREYVKNCSLLSVMVSHGVYDALLVVITLILL